MRRSDIEKIRDAGLVSEEQSAAIIAHFKLDRETNRFLVVIGTLGAILVSAGVILLIASNWETIPRSLKIASGLALLIGAHVGGWQLARNGNHPLTAELLHFVGSGLFLANIALVGQIYHLSSRPPNGLLLWLAGIAPLPWLLRSKLQHVLVLCAFGCWFGMELNQRGGWLYFDGDARQCVVFAMLGILFAGLGSLFNKTSFPEFAGATEKFGLLALHIATYPLTVGFFHSSREVAPSAWVVAGVLSAVATACVLVSASRQSAVEDPQWCWVWAFALCGALAVAWLGLTTKVDRVWSDIGWSFGPHWVASPLLFGFCLVQAQVGLIRRAPWMLNLAIVFIGLHIATAYLQLFGSMQTTGMMFLVTGVFLIGLSVALERKRRTLLQRMRSTPPASN